MKALPIGIQLYSLRDVLEETPQRFAAVMQQLRDYGYHGVELAGTYGLEGAYIQDTLGEIGLVPICAHLPLGQMMEDAEKVAKEYAAIGCRYIGVPYLPEPFRHGTPGYEKVIAEMTRIGLVMREHGLQLLYHNHDFEFVTLPDGSSGFDDIYKRVPPEALGAEPDTCWIKVAGEDPAEVIRRYSGRCPVVHIKDFIKQGAPKNLYQLIGIEGEAAAEEEGGIFEYRPIGFGQQVWLPVLEAAVQAGSEWVIVEQDEAYGMTSLEAARRSREYLKIIGW